LIDHLPVVVFEYTFHQDGKRNFTYISPRCEELLGLNPDTLLLGKLSLEEFIHPSDWTGFMISIDDSMACMKDWHWRGRCKGRRDFMWVEAQATPVRMKDGRTVYNGIFSDISEQKHLERQYQELVDQLPLGIVVHAGGIVKFANSFACQQLGARNPEEILEHPVKQFVHPDHWEGVSNRIRKILAGESMPPLEIKYVRLDGTIMDVEAAAHPYYYQEEPAVQIIFTDITERKKAEANLKKTETMFYRLFQNTPLAVALLNDNGNVVQINKGFEEMFGFSIGELSGRGLTEFIIPEDRVAEANNINSEIAHNRVVRMETMRHHKDGTMLSVIIYGVPVLQEDKTIGIFGMYVDITESKKVEEELKIRNAELDNFVYKVSHDLRAPLSSVLGLVHLAGMPGNDDNLADYLRLVGHKAEQLDHFISDVLSHSKNLKMELTVEEVDFHKIIDQTFSDLHYLRGAEGAKKHVEVAVDSFHSDPWRIAEILRNLVSNAIKYRKLEDSVLEIDLTVRTVNNHCTIIFQDNGIGIEQANLDKIFDMFYRASGQSDGSGLGLYIVRNAVEKLGGSVLVESELGAGTTFKISLPDQRLSK
jgi:PAS domain S-box-containing protein